jgi:hypothetical protein
LRYSSASRAGVGEQAEAGVDAINRLAADDDAIDGGGAGG